MRYIDERSHRKVSSDLQRSFLTIGHSNLSLDEFLDLLTDNEIHQVVDVRKLPGSTKYPQFNEAPLRESLAAQGIQLVRFEGLTGRRPVSKVVPFEVNSWWENRSFHNYADHALSKEFEEAFIELYEQRTSHRSVLMCAEAVWWRCHRRIIADHLLAQGAEVWHILGKKQVKPAELSSGARVSDDAVTYPARTPS